MKMQNTSEKLAFDRAQAGPGIRYIAGVDEVGRGPLAGPVVCAAVILPADEASLIEGVDDSKKLSPKKRELLAEKIRERAIACTVYEVSEKIIDEINILQATRLGMREALLAMKIPPDLVLTDGNMTLDIPFTQQGRAFLFDRRGEHRRQSLPRSSHGKIRRTIFRLRFR